MVNVEGSLHTPPATPAIAQLAEHLTVEACRNQMVPGSIPGRRICFSWQRLLVRLPKSAPMALFDFFDASGVLGWGVPSWAVGVGAMKLLGLPRGTWLLGLVV